MFEKLQERNRGKCGGESGRKSADSRSESQGRPLCPGDIWLEPTYKGFLIKQRWSKLEKREKKKTQTILGPHLIPQIKKNCTWFKNKQKKVKIWFMNETFWT